MFSRSSRWMMSSSLWLSPCTLVSGGVTFFLNAPNNITRWLEPRIEGPAPDPDNPYVAVDIKFINELWVPDIYVYFLKRINVLTVFTKFAGLFIVNGNEILYSQETHITFWCPMRFNNFPLDKQVCKFKVATYIELKSRSNCKGWKLCLWWHQDDIHSLSALLWWLSEKHYIGLHNKVRSAIQLDYMHSCFQRLQALKPEDSFFEWTSINSNYSLTGYEMVLNRNSLKYIVNYYLPSGLFVLGKYILTI